MAVLPETVVFRSISHGTPPEMVGWLGSRQAKALGHQEKNAPIALLAPMPFYMVGAMVVSDK